MSLQVTTLSITLKGTKPASESMEGLAVQAEALQHLAGVVMACAARLKVRSHHVCQQACDTYALRSGVQATAPAWVFRISRGLSRYPPMSEVCALRHLAGLVSTHG